MPEAIEFSTFKGGLDRRRDVAMSASNVLATLRNLYINDAGAIKKRPVLTPIATLEAGTKGLRAAGGKLNTFYSQNTPITHADTRFRATRVTYDAPYTAVVDVHYGEIFNGFLYCAVEFTGGVTKHFYLDDPGSWAALTALGGGAFRRPTTVNGYRYEVTGAGTTAAGEPIWPTVIGGTVVDGTVTWTCRSFAIVDTNCPHSKIVKKVGQKIYGASAGNVPYCATSAPRDWTTASNAGFIPASNNAAGSDTVTALGEYSGDLIVFFSDSLQQWDIDADPSLNALVDNVANIGTVHKDSPARMANDLIFLGKQGFRSLSLVTITDNLQESDVGNPIDAERPSIADADRLIGTFYPTLGQLWEIHGDTVYAYKYSKSAKISAWAIYDFSVTIEAAAVLNNEMYVRSGDVVYKVDNTSYVDANENPDTQVNFFYQDNKLPGILKQFVGFKALVRGSWEIAFKYDPRDETLITPFFPIAGDIRPDQMFPMELCATSVAPVLRHSSNEDASIHQLLLYYEKLGPA